MDPITHAALGGACAQAILQKKDPRNAWMVGALAAMAPDLDVLIQSQNDPMLAFLYHRNFTHSLLFIPVGALFAALCLLIFKRFRVHWTYTLLAALIGYSTHALLDACTTYGTMLLWPFSNRRISWDIIAIVDPFFTVPLILGIIWTLIFHNRKGVVTGLSVACAFLLFNIFQHHRALKSAHEYAKNHAMQWTRLRAIPWLMSSVHWRLVGQDTDNIFVADTHTPVYKHSTVYPLAHLPLFTSDQLPAYVTDSPTLTSDYNLFNWFTENYVVLASRNPLILGDGRFLYGDKTALFSLWGIRFNPAKVHINRVGLIKLELLP